MADPVCGLVAGFDEPVSPEPVCGLVADFELTGQILSHRSTVQTQFPSNPPPRPSLLVQGDNALLFVHFELIHHPKCSKYRNTQANASPQMWLVLTRNLLSAELSS